MEAEPSFSVGFNQPETRALLIQSQCGSSKCVKIVVLNVMDASGMIISPDAKLPRGQCKDLADGADAEFGVLAVDVRHSFNDGNKPDPV